ncbi:MAG: VOC family protein [Syntrophobacterales bacterium]|jgi:methylmalonyl-CoA/ethylmalonyl-CoA epimerase|nr:VOC family protein [Syntrophobacterales bacterium]
MISRIDHVAIAARDYREVADFFRTILGASPGTSSVDQDQKYLAETFSLGDLSRIEIITPTEEGSFLDKFLAERQGIHHLCLQTLDIREARRALDEHGIPYFGYYECEGDGWKELFIHPRDAFGVLIQIAEFTPDDFIADELKVPGGARWTVEKTSNGATLTFTHPGGGTVRFNMSRDELKALAEDLTEAG